MFEQNKLPHDNFMFKKQVRFNTPSKSDPRLFQSEELPPKHNHVSFSNQNQSSYFPLCQTVKTTDNVNYARESTPNVLLRQREPPNSAFFNSSFPRPANELELSALDSDPDAFSTKTLNFNRNKPMIDRSMKENALPKPIHNNDDMPYKTLHKKMPYPIYDSDRLSNLHNFSEETLAKAISSKKEFDMNGSHMDFFTKPNTASRFSNDMYVKQIRDEVISSKDKFQQIRNTTKKTSSPLSDYNIRSPIQKRIYVDDSLETSEQESCNCKCTKSKKKPVPKKNTSFKIQDGLEEKRKALLKNKNQTINNRDSSDSDSEQIVKSNNNDIPTVADLYNIIKVQNEQLQSLQQRVDQFINMKVKNQKESHVITQRNIEISESSVHSVQRKCVETDRLSEEVHKISIGVMTSFELVMSSKEKKDKYVDECVQTSRISKQNDDKIRRNRLSDLAKIGNCKNARLSDLEKIVNRNDARLSDIENIGNSSPVKIVPNNLEKDLETSCVMTESLMKKLDKSSPPVSPPPSLHIKIDDYSESEDDEYMQPGVEWTFYNNVMNRVNQVLYNSPPLEKDSHRHKFVTDQMKQRCELTDINVSKKVTFNDAVAAPRQEMKASSETSLHMKKLAAKYLGHVQEEPPTTPAADFDILTNLRNEMSFATLQYMQKYNLISGPNYNVFDDEFKRKIKLHNTQKHLRPARKAASKILDITAIKNQPKLI